MSSATSGPLVVVVAYRNTDDLRAAVDSLGAGQDLIVVDNDADGAVRALVEAYGGQYVDAGGNVGFAAAVNLALEQRAGRDVLLLNPDARVSPDLPGRLAEALRADGRLAAVAPGLRFPSGEPQRATWPVPSPWEAWVDALGLRRFVRPRRSFLVGAVLLLRDAAITDVGPFDERYFLYAEECDWQFRALRRGWRLSQLDGVWAEHAEGGSSEHGSVREVHFHRSAERFGRKWYGAAGWQVMRAASVTGAALRLAARASSAAARAEYAQKLKLYLRGTDRRVA